MHLQGGIRWTIWWGCAIDRTIGVAPGFQHVARFGISLANV
jgi:hypothetical protein